MVIKRITSVFLATSMLTQSIAPTFAMEEANADNDNIINNVKNCYSPPSPTPKKGPLNASAKQNNTKTGAGILHYALHNGEIHILLGQRNDGDNDWCNFGGASDDIDMTL